MRVSDRKQKKLGDGQDSQIARCSEFAAMRGYEVVRVIRDDISGKHASRPGMDELLAFLRQNPKTPHIVIIDQISCFARHVSTHLQLRAALKAVGGKLVSPSRDYADDPEEDPFEIMEALFAAEQRRQIGETTRSRTRGRFLNGYWGYRSCIGFKMVASERGKVLVHDEPIASAIREIFEGYASGRFSGPAEIVRCLRNDPRWPQKRRKTLTIQRVIDVLNRPLYAGYLHAPDKNIHMKRGNHEPIISLKTFRTVQERMAANSKAPARTNINEDFPLRTFVFCSDCERPYTACWSKGRAAYHPYMLCQTKGCASYGKSIRRDMMEAEFEGIVTRLSPSPELYSLAEARFRDLYNEKAALADSQRDTLKAEAKQVERQITQLVDRILNTADSPTLVNAYEDHVRKLEIEKADIAERVAKCGSVLPDYDDTFRTAMDFLTSPIKLWNSNKLEDKHALLKLAFERHLSYKRGEGFRTAKPALPFRVFRGLASLDSDESEMVRLRYSNSTLI